MVEEMMRADIIIQRPRLIGEFDKIMIKHNEIITQRREFINIYKSKGWTLSIEFKGLCALYTLIYNVMGL
jgi:hypothetical protein